MFTLICYAYFIFAYKIFQIVQIEKIVVNTEHVFWSLRGTDRHSGEAMSMIFRAILKRG